MTSDRNILMSITRIEAGHLANLVTQFRDMLDNASSDLASARLTPASYPDDADDNADMHEITRTDLLERRAADVTIVLQTLAEADINVDLRDAQEEGALDEVAMSLSNDQAHSWLRTLSAVRLVLASRLGITAETDVSSEDPLFGIYEWVGFRLDGLVRAIDE